ncbi:MAG: response regulator transcription factor [Acidobacteriia bacterium]|nr:response regulator transcription factor [Terriglobia bacterium]
MKQSIIVLEDEPDISNLVRFHLQQAGYAVHPCMTGDKVLSLAAENPPSLFILDIMVPGMNGLEVCRRIRANKTLALTPIVFLTARSTEDDKIKGLDLGADDYITKPFSPRELLARVKAILRRSEQPVTTTITTPDWELNSESVTLTVHGKPVEVTATEFRLLYFFATHPGRVFTRDQVLDAVWKETSFVTPRSVDVYVRRLREKIEQDPEDPRYLLTVRGSGYKYEAPR